MHGGGYKKINSAADRKGRVTRGGGGNSDKGFLLLARIKREIGSLLFSYYFFVYKYGKDPVDIVDFFDGLAALNIITEMDTPRL